MTTKFKDNLTSIKIIGVMALLMLLFAHAFANANTVLDKADSVVKEVKSTITAADTSQISHRIYNDIKAGLEGMAAALKVGAEHVYIVLVKQQVVNAVIGILSILFNLILVLTFWYRHVTAYRDCKKEFDDKNGSRYTFKADHWDAPVVINLILALVCTIVLPITVGCNINEVVMGFINPEYGALRDILYFVK